MAVVVHLTTHRKWEIMRLLNYSSSVLTSVLLLYFHFHFLLLLLPGIRSGNALLLLQRRGMCSFLSFLSFLFFPILSLSCTYTSISLSSVSVSLSVCFHFRSFFAFFLS